MEETIRQGKPNWTPRRVILATLAIAAVAISFWLLVQYRIVVFSLFEAIVFSTAIAPLSKVLIRRGFPRGVSIAAVFLLLMALLAGFVFLAAPLIIDQSATVSRTLSSFYQQFLRDLSGSNSILLRRLVLRLPTSIFSFTQPPTTSQSNSLDTVNLLLSYLGIVSNTLFAIFSVFLLTFYWTLDHDRTIRSFLLLFPTQQRDKVRGIFETTENRVGAYIRGVAILSFSVGLLAMLSYLIIGLPHAFLLGLIAGVLEVVPIVGPFLGAIPAIVVALSSDPNKILWVILAYLVIQFSENHLLVPRIMDKTVGVNPVVSLLAFAAFSSLFGFAGALLAIPMAVLIQIILNRFLIGPEMLTPPTPVDRTPISVLRYETEELMQDVRKQIRVKEGDIVDEPDELEDAIESIAEDLSNLLNQASKEGEEEGTK